MAEADSENQLLDGIVGKYGEDSDCGDLVNADEDALLEDGIFKTNYIPGKRSTYEDEEELDHEPEEPDGEDVLDLIAQEELEDDDDKAMNANQSCTLIVSSTTPPDVDLGLQNDAREHERNTYKFKNERQVPTVKSHINIPDSLDEISVPNNNNRNYRNKQKQFKIRQRNANFQGQLRNPLDVKTVHINPHFKGQVKVNNNARLAWDARQKLNSKNQTRRTVQFVVQNDVKRVQPWLPNNNSRQSLEPPPPQQSFQHPPPQHVYLQTQQVSNWNQFPQQNSFTNQVVPQVPVNQQHCFMQPLPPPPTILLPQQFNQPQSQYPPVYQHHHQPMYNQFMQPPNQYNMTQNMEPVFNSNQTYLHNQPPIFSQPPPTNTCIPPPQPQPPMMQYQQQQFSNHPPKQLQQQYNNFINEDHQPNNQFTNQQRFIGMKPMNIFNNPPKQNQIHYKNQNINKIKMSVDNIDLRKKKRNLASSNLHEVRTVEIPDTTMKEDKFVMKRDEEEEEDEETVMYRKKIEEQKRVREKILEQKEARRREAAQQKQIENPDNHMPPQQQNFQKPQVLATRGKKKFSFPSSNSTDSIQTIKKFPIKNSYNNSNIKVIDTTTKTAYESNYDKQHLASFLCNRKILSKDENLIDTECVVVSNLANGTTPIKLRKMCQGIGEIKKLQMSPKERQATIQFNSVASAHEFFKKYQRTMLDLSMIQVALKPMS